MAQYSIKDLENFTNIKAHTLRIWEQRYNLLEPKRTDTNIRYYSDKDLKKILNINLLYSNGYKISKIAQLKEKEITRLAADILELDSDKGPDQVDYFIRYIIELNERKIQKKLVELSDEAGIEKMYADILVPLLVKIGNLWQVDAISVSHEHFFSNILREFFITETAKISSPKKNRGKIILFLHEHEMHELSLLYYHYVLKKRGYECYYLGQNVPMKDLKMAIEQKKPDYVFTSIISETDRSFFTRFVKELCQIIAARKICMGGQQLLNYHDLIPESIHILQSQNDLNF